MVQYISTIQVPVPLPTYMLTLTVIFEIIVSIHTMFQLVFLESTIIRYLTSISTGMVPYGTGTVDSKTIVSKQKSINTYVPYRTYVYQ